MNERIRELWDKAAEDTAAFPSGQNNSWQTQVNFMDRFAKLIVRECVGIVEGRGFLHDQAPDAIFARECSSAIKRHFGVK
jgi:hypothetical protein